MPRAKPERRAPAEPRPSPVRMSMMTVGHVGVCVPQTGMAMPMAVRAPRIDQPVMLVIVMRVVSVAVLVRHLLVLVFVVMALADVQPHAERHQ